MRRSEPKQLVASEWKTRHLKSSGTVVTHPSFLSRFSKEPSDEAIFHVRSKDQEAHRSYQTTRRLILGPGHRVTLYDSTIDGLSTGGDRTIEIRALVGDYDQQEVISSPYGLGFCSECGKVIKGGDEIVSIETGMVNEAGTPTAQKDSYQMFNIHKKCHRETE